jgi:hypothetical protein
MNEQDYEQLSQFIDGELDPTQAQALRERLIADPGLRAELEHMRAVDNRVRQAFDFADAEAVPDAVVAQVRGSAVPRNVRQRRWGLAVAASLVAAAGLILAPQWQEGGHSGTDLLATALETTPSSNDGWEVLADGRKMRPVLSFSSLQGHWCREFLVTQDTDINRGVACRAEGRWQTRIMATAQAPGATTDYRPAGATDADIVATFIDTQAANIPLSLDQEAELIARGWE